MIIRTINQFKMEKAIIDENATRFQLVHSSSLFESRYLEKIGTCGLNQDT